jgi:hypothetical protein
MESVYLFTCLRNSVPTQWKQPTTFHFIGHPFYYSRITYTKSLSFLGQPLARISNSNGPPLSVRLLPRKQTNTGISTSVIAETQWSTSHTAHFPARPANVTNVCSWRLCGINRAILGVLAHFAQFVCLFR